jgi:hypothetical protein
MEENFQSIFSTLNLIAEFILIKSSYKYKLVNICINNPEVKRRQNYPEAAQIRCGYEVEQGVSPS